MMIKSALLFAAVAVFCVCSAQDPNSYNGLGHVVCAGKMMIPHTAPCNATDPCDGKLFCAPREQDQYSLIHQQKDGKDQIVTSGKLFCAPREQDQYSLIHQQ